MTNLMTVTSEQFGELQSIELNGKIYFKGKAIARALGYRDTVNALKLHCRPEGVVKHHLPTSGGKQEANFIDEGNVYRLIIKSKLPEAEKFERWVFDEVLPSIRKTGRYESKAPQKKSLRILDLRGLKVISTTDIANYFGVANATIASHAKAIGEYGILLEGAEMRRFKSENPNLPKSTSSMIVYSLSVAEAICKRLGEEVTLRPTKVPTLPSPYPSTPSVTGDLDGALAAFNYIVREAQRLSNPDLRKAHLTVLMGVYVAISHMLKTA